MNLVENSVWNLDVNGKPAINALGELEQKLAEVKAAQADLKRGTKEWTDSKAEIKQLEAEIKKTREEMGTAGMTVKQLEGYYKQLNRELKDLTPGTDAYIEKTKDLQDVNTRLAAVRADTRAIKEEVDKSKSTWDNLKDWVTGALAAFSIVGILESVINFTRESLKMAAGVSDAFGGIQKATGMTADEVKVLNAEIGKIDTRTAQESLLDIAQVGGQIGVANKEMLGFVESVDKAVVALGDEFSGGAEEVAGTMGKLSKLFKETKDLEAGEAINDIGSAINELGAAGTATGPVVADFAMRMGQLGDLSPQISETLGLGAAFQEMGLTAEIASGGLTNILGGAAAATAQFADHLGMTEDKFKNLINTNPNEVILQLAASFKGLPTDVVVKQMNDLDIKSQEAQKTMMILANQTDIVRDKQELAAKAMAEGTSLTNEFNVMNNTAAAMLEKQQKAADALKVQLGTALLPALLGVTTASIAFVKGIQALPEFLSENKEMIIALGVALVTFNGALIAATANSLAYAAAEKASIIWKQSSAVAQYALNTAMALNPIAQVITVVALLAAGFIYLYKNSETLRGVISGVWEALKAGVQIVIDIAENIWKGFQQLIDKFPLITRAFDAVRDGIKAAFEVVGDVIDWVGGKIDDLGDFFTGLYNKIVGVGQAIGNALQPGFDVMIAGFNTVRNAVNSFLSLVESGINKVGGFIKSITPEGFTSAAKVFTDAGSRISKAFNDAFSSEQSKGHAQQTAASLYTERTNVTDQLEASFRMGMRGYGRFKDMRQVSYAKFPNVESLKEYIEELGVDKFISNDTVSINGKNVQLYVPGYYIGRKQKKQITHERAVTRIAYGMGRAVMDRNTIRRRGNSFYNVNKGEIYGDIAQYLMKKLPPEMMNALKEYYEKPFYEKAD